MRKIVKINGGIGKVICALPAIEKLAEEHMVDVISGWPDVFLGHPDVARNYTFDDKYLYENVIKGNELIIPEPYDFHKYYNDDDYHIITAFSELLLGEPIFSLPKLYVNPVETFEANKFLQEKNPEAKKVIAFQAFSATYVPQADLDPTHRSLKMGFVKKIADAVDAVFVNLSTTPIEHERVINFQFATRDLFSLTNQADFCLGIDSCLVHLACGLRKPGYFIYGGTSPKKLGYDVYPYFQKPDYPKAFQPFGMSTIAMEDVNRGASDFTEKEEEEMIETITTLLNPAELPGGSSSKSAEA